MTELWLPLLIVGGGIGVYLLLRRGLRALRKRLSGQKSRSRYEQTPFSSMRPKKAEALITYIDGVGRETERRVSITHYTPRMPSGNLYGYCHLRRDMRTFKAKRIVKFVDVETGEVIDNPIRWMDLR